VAELGGHLPTQLIRLVKTNPIKDGRTTIIKYINAMRDTGVKGMM